MNKLIRHIHILAGKIQIRLRAAKRVLFDVNDGFVLIQINETNKRNLLQGKEIEVTTLYVALQPYLIDVMFQKIANSKDDVDILLSKIAFEEEAKLQYPKN